MTPFRIGSDISSRSLASSPPTLRTSPASPTSSRTPLTRQFDDETDSATVHSIAHALSDVDLAEIARVQRPIADEPASSLRLKTVRFPGVDLPVVCDTSLGRPRVLVPDGSSPTYLHGDTRPRAPFRQGHPRHHRPVVCLAQYAPRRPPLVETVPGLCGEQGRQAHDPACPANPRTRRTFRSRPPRRGRPLLSGPGKTVPVDDDRPDHALGRSTPDRRHDGRHHPPDLPGAVDFALRDSHHGYDGSRCPIHFAIVAHSPPEIGNPHLRHHRLPSPGEWCCGKVPPDPQKRPPLCRPLEPVVDTFSPLGAARPAERAEDGHGHLYRRNPLRHTPSSPWTMFPGRAIALTICRGPARLG